MTYEAWRERFFEAIDEELFPRAWLDRRVASGRARFWGNERAAILCEIKTFPSGAREAHGLVAAGDIAEIKRLIIEAETWGRERGCVRASISSHPAWARLLRDEGYQISQVSIVKGL